MNIYHLYETLISGTLVLVVSLPATPSLRWLGPSQQFLVSREKPDCSTLFLASSHMSQLDNFQTWAAMLYSSISGSLVKWNWSGSSEDREMLRPRIK